MDEVNHLHAFVIIQVALVNAPARRPHDLYGRQIVEIVIHFFQIARPEVIENLVHPSLSLSEKQ